MTISPKTTIALPWFTAHDYATARAMMADHHALPAEFDAWESAELELEAATIANGTDVQRVTLESGRFRAWCAANAAALDQNARLAYADKMGRELALAA